MPERPQATFLDDILVVELGQRLGSGICGSLLAETAATVVTVEASAAKIDGPSKLAARDSLAAGKLSLTVDPLEDRDVRLAADLLARADVALVSSDTNPAWPSQIVSALANVPIVSDLTAFGDRGPLAGV